MEFFPSSAIFLRIGSLEIRWYAVLIMSGALLAYYLYSKELKKNGYTQDDADNLFLGCFLCGILCARIWYVLFSDLSYYLEHPTSILAIWEGGLAIHGGLIGGVLFALYYCKKRKMNFLRACDSIIPYVMLAQAIGRWGNFMNKEAFGQPVSEEYFAHWPSFLNFVKEGMYINGSYQEPMFFYESVLCLIGFGLIMLYKKVSSPKRGDLTGCYFLWYGMIRFWIESRRSDSLMFMGMKMAQIISILLMLLGLLLLFGFFRRKKVKPVLIFDNDGTLVDTTPLIKASFTHAFKEFKPDYELSPEELDSFLGPPLVDTFAKYFPQEQVDELVKCYKEHNDVILKEVKALPEVKETLKKWHDEGYRMAVVSVKHRETILDGFKYCGIDENWFEVILGGEDVTKNKPDPEGILTACERMGVSHDDVVYVGDAVSDMKAAKNMGAFSIGYAAEEHRLEKLRGENPNRVVEHFGEIDNILKEEHSWTYNMR